MWFSEMLMGGITQALFTRRRPSCCCQAWGVPGAAAPAWAGLAPCGGNTVLPVTPKPPEWGAMLGHLGWVRGAGMHSAGMHGAGV